MQMRDGYTDGHQGAWIMDPDVFSTAFQAYWDADYQLHVHNANHRHRKLNRPHGDRSSSDGGLRSKY